MATDGNCKKHGCWWVRFVCLALDCIGFSNLNLHLINPCSTISTRKWFRATVRIYNGQLGHTFYAPLALHWACQLEWHQNRISKSNIKSKRLYIFVFTIFRAPWGAGGDPCKVRRAIGTLGRRSRCTPEVFKMHAWRLCTRIWYLKKFQDSPRHTYIRTYIHAYTHIHTCICRH